MTCKSFENVAKLRYADTTVTSVIHFRTGVKNRLNSETA